MTASIEFFPVGSGDMTLIRLQTGRTILIDINIRQKADQDSENKFPDVAGMLKERVDRDADGRPFVDVFMLSHPDQDHISGLRKHFHLGAPSTWKKPDGNESEKIIIREMWSSPLTFRRVDKVDGALGPDAEAWRKEAKRRVKLFRDGHQSSDEDGNFIRVLGEDVHHDKTEGIERLLVKTGEALDEICRKKDSSFSALLLSPKMVTEEEAAKLPGKNNSSIVMQFSLTAAEDHEVAGKFLTGGDAEVDIWGRIWQRNKETPENLEYHILQAPHHCSLGALSYDQYSDQNGKPGKGEDCEIDPEAYEALSQAKAKSIIVGSMDVPERESGRGLARRKYTKLAEGVGGQMLCTMDDSKDRPLKISITESGPTLTDESPSASPVPEKVNKGRSERGYA